MILSLIAAVSENNVIGRDGKVPWQLPTDLKLFKQLTMGHYLIVGRKTYESIGRPLPGRRMIVLSKQQGYKVEGCQTAGSLSHAIGIARMAGEAEAFIGGGAEVYAEALPLADRFYLSRVHAEFKGDTHFPIFDPSAWKVTLAHKYPAGEGQRYDFTFYILDRKKGAV